MNTNRTTTILRGAAAGGLLLLAGLVLPGTAFGQDYGGGPGVRPPTVNPPQVPPVNPPQIPIVPTTGGRSGSFSSSSAPLGSINPVSASISPVSLAARPVTVSAPPAPAPVVSQVLGRTVETPPEVPAVVPPPVVEEIAPRVAAPPIEEEAPRAVTRPPDEVLGRVVRPGPGLVQARVLPKAGEGLAEPGGIWPPLALGLAGLGLAVVTLAWPRRRAQARLA